MCGIVGAINLEEHSEKAKKALDIISYRGIDGKDFYGEENLTFGHCLHSVVGNKSQPIKQGNWVFGTNCEIYNWKELNQELKSNSNNDAEFLFNLLIKNLENKTIEEIDSKLINQTLKQLDGVFAFFLYNKKEQYTLIARDVLGEKPIWFNYDKSLIFASENKAIETKEITPEELNPRKILLYSHKNQKLKLLNQEFFKQSEELKLDETELEKLLLEAIKKRIPQRNLGILFSGGLDSTLLAFILKKLNIKFTAYMTVVESKYYEIQNAIKIAKELDFELKITKITEDELEKELPKIINLIESADPVKVEVGATMYFSLKRARKNDIKVIFSGLGADDIFCGYKRMHMAQNITLDSISNLRRIYERDLYRDDVLSMANNIELRLPYLDKSLVQACLNIPNKHKIGEQPKELMRKISRNMGLSEEFSNLKRQAAQYSSGVGKVLNKIMKRKKKRYKGKYFAELFKKKNIKLGVLFSSGKDSVYALHIQHRLNYPIDCLITIDSKNKDSYMFHTPTINLAKYQAKALELPIIIQETDGKKEHELKDLELALKTAKNKHKIQGIITGALFSNYQRTRIEEICDKLNLKCYSPLWHMDQETEMRYLIENKYSFIMSKVAAEGLDKSWLGKEIDAKDLNNLIELNKKLNINIAGEGGEFETFVLDAPLFKKRLEIKKSRIQEESENCATLVIEELESKKKV